MAPKCPASAFGAGSRGWTSSRRFCASTLLDYSPTSINSEGDGLEMNEDSGTCAIHYAGDSVAEVITGASEVWDMNSAQLPESGDGSVNMVSCPQVVGVDDGDNYAVFQQDPDTGDFNITELNDAVPASCGFSGIAPCEINDSGEISATGSDAAGNEHVLLLVPVKFNVTQWTPTITTPGISYQKNSNGTYVGVTIDSSSGNDVFQLTASVQIAYPFIPSSIGDHLASQWDLYLHQDLIEQSVNKLAYTNETDFINVSPIPGEDESSDDAPYSIPQSQAFSQNNQAISLTFNDTPFEYKPVYWPTNGQFNPQDPLVAAQREDQFMTWLYAKNRVTGQIVYLKWIQWQINYNVSFDFTKATPDTRNTWVFKEIAEGDGMGLSTPSQTPFQVTDQIQSNP